MFHLQKLFKSSLKNWRKFSNVSCNNVLERLENRKILSVSGQDIEEYLQGLITNDIKHLSRASSGSMYALFLNTKGRVLYDVIIYKTNKYPLYLIECDKDSLESLKKHLSVYRVRRKIEIREEKNLNVYALFNPESASNVEDIKAGFQNLQGSIIPCSQLNNTLPKGSNDIKLYKDICIFVDPRIVYLGNRIVASSDCDVRKELGELFDNLKEKRIENNYRRFRYKLGVGEGTIDLPPGNCFPLESNSDYLHGISFHKGCYIGQELTARTYHTGVVRKRLMPVSILIKPTEIEEDLKIRKEGKRLGVLRGFEGEAGIALLNVAEALEMKEIKIGNGLIKIEKPFWWPLEAPKELSQKS